MNTHYRSQRRHWLCCFLVSFLLPILSWPGRCASTVTVTRLEQGVYLKRFRNENLYGSRQNFSIIDADLNVAKIGLRLPFLTAGKRASVSEFAAKTPGAIAAINAQFFDRQGSIQFLKVNGTVINSTRSQTVHDQQALSVDAAGAISILLRPQNGWQSLNHIPTVMASGAALFTNGVRASFDPADDTYAKRHPRTAVAMTTDNHLLLLIIDGRSANAAGQTGAEMQTTLMSLGKIHHAFNVDGGGSSTLWVKGAVVNTPSDGKERPVANAIVLTAAPAAGTKTATAALVSATAANASFEGADKLVRAAVDNGDAPGAVLFIEQGGRTKVRQAYGNAVLRPTAQPMSSSTIFDLASLTKPVATSTAAMLLWERGQLDLDAPVAKYLPLFSTQPDKARITVRHLLTHTAGLAAGGAYSGKTLTLAQMIGDIVASSQKSAPGEKFLYSDFSFITLGAVVEAVSGLSLDEFCRRNIFAPLGMNDTFFRRNATPLAAQLLARVAPTTSGDDMPETRALVHDPSARAVGGVAGHAGLFSTADDLARFCRMILNGGTLNGFRLLKPETVKMWTSSQSPQFPGERALGWDIGSAYSIRGALSPASFGHTGFTGTSMWIDPATQAFIVLLTNSVHNKPVKSVVALRRAVSNAVASDLGLEVANTPVQSGLEVLLAENFKRLEGRKLGVVCNHTAVDRQGSHLVDLMVQNKNLNIVALFGPEHGIRGDVDTVVSNSQDTKTGLKVFSLYDYRLPAAQRYRPTPEMLQGIDTLVFDIQDIGSRYYTYISTLGYVLEAAAQHGIKVIVLDRPNPLGGELVEGPNLNLQFASFAAYHNMPITHGMTIGELALLFNAERKIGADVEVVQMKNWRRTQLFDATGLPWLNPSPNIRNVRQAWLYGGVGFLEVLPLSVGRGTDTPFEIVGAPWLDAVAVAADLNARNLPGVTFTSTRFTPTYSTHKGVASEGVQIFLWDRSTNRPAELGIHLIDAIRRRHPDRLTLKELTGARGMIGNEPVVEMLARGETPQNIIASWRNDVAEWRTRRAPFLLYR